MTRQSATLAHFGRTQMGCIESWRMVVALVCCNGLDSWTLVATNYTRSRTSSK